MIKRSKLDFLATFGVSKKLQKARVLKWYLNLNKSTFDTDSKYVFCWRAQTLSLKLLRKVNSSFKAENHV